MTENENPFAGAEIISDASLQAGLDPLGDPIEPAAVVPPPRDPVSLPGSVPWNPQNKAGKVPRIFVDPLTGGIVEIAKKDQTFLRQFPALGRNGAADYANISKGRADHLMKLPAIQQYLRNVLQAAGVTDEKIAQRVAEGLDATSQKEFSDGKGGVIAGEEKPDHDQRGKFVDRALKMMGMEKPEVAAGGAGSPLPALGALAALKPEELTLVLEALKRQQAEAEATEAVVIVEPPPAPNEPDDISGSF